MKKRPGPEREPAQDLKFALFAAAYVKHNCNRTAAARAAGYGGKDESLAVQGSVLLREPKVQAHLAEIRREAAMDALESIQRMTDFARNSIDPFLDEQGNIDLTTPQARAAIHLVKGVSETFTAGIVTRRRIELYSALEATKTLMQFHGLLEVVLRDKPKTGRELDEVLYRELKRVKGKEFADRCYGGEPPAGVVH